MSCQYGLCLGVLAVCGKWNSGGNTVTTPNLRQKTLNCFFPYDPIHDSANGVKRCKKIKQCVGVFHLLNPRSLQLHSPLDFHPVINSWTLFHRYHWGFSKQTGRTLTRSKVSETHSHSSMQPGPDMGYISKQEEFHETQPSVHLCGPRPQHSTGWNPGPDPLSDSACFPSWRSQAWPNTAAL